MVIVNIGIELTRRYDKIGKLVMPGIFKGLISFFSPMFH